VFVGTTAFLEVFVGLAADFRAVGVAAASVAIAGGVALTARAGLVGVGEGSGKNPPTVGVEVWKVLVGCAWVADALTGVLPLNRLCGALRMQARLLIIMKRIPPPIAIFLFIASSSLN
jgi:hypothetical protein